MPNYFNRSIRQQRLQRVITALTYEWQTFLELKAKANFTNNASLSTLLNFLIDTHQVESIHSQQEIRNVSTKTFLYNKQKLYRLKVK